MSNQMKTIKLEIDGMSCSHCVAAVKEALNNVDGVDAVSVEIGSAEVAVDSSASRISQIAAALLDKGYPLTGSVVVE